MYPHRQVQKMPAQLHGAKLPIRKRHQRLLVSAMEHLDCMHEVLDQAATQRRDHVVEFAVIVIDHVLHDLCKRDKQGDGTGSSSGGSAV